MEFSPRRKTILRRVLIFCASAELVLFLLDYHVNYARLTELSPIRNFFNTTREDALASWFGVTQTGLVALTLWIVFILTRERGAARATRIGWGVLAGIFTYMAIDDGAELHERMGSAFKQAAENANGEGFGSALLDLFPSYPWQIIFVPIFGAIGIFMLVFLWRNLSTRAARGMLIAGLSSFCFAVALDFVEGLEEDHAWNLYAHIGSIDSVERYTRETFRRQGFTAMRHFGKSVEECVEMFGMTLLWIAFLGEAMRPGEQIRIRWQKE